MLGVILLTIQKLSKKQARIMQWWIVPQIADRYDTLICDGAVRSGKTIVMTISFILWAMSTFDKQNFAICGKTVGSIERNIIEPLMNIADIRKAYKITFYISRNKLIIRKKGGKTRNTFYLYGGKDESSYMLIQGVTLTGVLFDEVALMVESFVNQAIARTVSEEGRRLWFNCNPDHPNHWFYQNWILKSKAKNAVRLHFLMEDNPILTQKQIETAKATWEGSFYDRYILGSWVAAENKIYSMFKNEHVVTSEQIKELTEDNPLMLFAMGVDFGGNKSATAFTLIGITRGYKNVFVLDEVYDSKNISAEHVVQNFKETVARWKKLYPSLVDCYVDSAESLLKKSFDFSGARVNVHNAKKSPINDRIYAAIRLMAQGRFFVSKSCPKLIEAFETAVWDDKEKTKDLRLDNGTTNIDSLDSFEYALEPYIRDLLGL